MAGYKATGIVFLKESLRKAGPDKEKLFMTFLNDEERNIWEKLVSFHWIPVELANKFSICGSKVLYPAKTQEEALYLSGIERAKNDFNKVYRLIFKIINLDTLLKKAASIWSTHHQAGECTSEVIEKESFGFYTVTNYPDLPKETARVISGYIHGLLEIAGRKNIAVTEEKHDTGWRWRLSYK